MDDRPMTAGAGAGAFELYRLPFLLWSAWMEQWLSLIASARPTPAAPKPTTGPASANAPAAHDTLEVPEPIEAEGEHALFA